MAGCWVGLNQCRELKRRIRSVNNVIESICDVASDALSLQEGIYLHGPGVQGHSEL